MAMELLINSQTVEPFESAVIYRPVRKTIKPPVPPAPAVEQIAQPSGTRRIEKTRCGRGILSCARWGIVLTLVLLGYFGAELISNSVGMMTAHLAHSAPQPVVANAEIGR